MILPAGMSGGNRVKSWVHHWSIWLKCIMQVSGKSADLFKNNVTCSSRGPGNFVPSVWSRIS